MTEPLPEDQRLVDISSKAYEHPADRAATAALQSIPMLDQVVRKLIEFGYERALRQVFLAGSVKLGSDQLPEVWAAHRAALARLDITDVPELYLTQFPITNAAAIGSERPMVVINSRTVEVFDAAEMRTVLGHEAGHILSDHVLYRTALMILLSATGLGRMPMLAGLPLLAVKMALLEWFRAAELSCDRAATLVNRDPLVSCRTLMVLAGGTASRKLDLDAFVRQASAYEEWEPGFDKLARMRIELGQTHGFPVKRVSELMKWVRSGDYDRIVDGSYVRRGEPVDARAEAGDAVEFYAERFRAIFRDAAAGDRHAVAPADGRAHDRRERAVGDRDPLALHARPAAAHPALEEHGDKRRRRAHRAVHAQRPAPARPRGGERDPQARHELDRDGLGLHPPARGVAREDRAHVGAVGERDAGDPASVGVDERAREPRPGGAAGLDLDVHAEPARRRPVGEAQLAADLGRLDAADGLRRVHRQ